MFTKKRLIILIVIIAIVAGGYFISNRSNEGSVIVERATVYNNPVSRTVSGSGEVTS